MLTDTLSNSAHLHLLLNHIPTVGFGLAFGLLLAGLAARNEEWKRAALALLFVVATISIATYVSGNAAASLLASRAGDETINGNAVRAHEDAALLGFIFIEITGFFAWVAMWQRRGGRFPTGHMAAVVVAGFLTLGLMARASTLGGAIHHPEILTAQASGDSQAGAQADGGAAASDDGWARRFGENVVQGYTWVWPTLEALHFVGLCMLFAPVLIVNLRLLGMVKRIPGSAVRQLLPLGLLGFGLNLVTGMMFFIGEFEQYVHNPVFFWKIVFVVLGGLNAVVFMLDERIWAVKAGEDAPSSAKLTAGSAIVIWAAVLFCGHMLPFLGNAF